MPLTAPSSQPPQGPSSGAGGAGTTFATTSRPSPSIPPSAPIPVTPTATSSPTQISTSSSPPWQRPQILAVCLRIHVVVLASRRTSVVDTAVAFSFPLCGATQADWTSSEAMRFLRAQVVEFSHHLGDQECTDVFGCFLGLARFMIVAGRPEEEERQLIMYLFVETRILPCYVYIHEDEIMLDMARELATQTWACLRRALGERLSMHRGRLDLDYSLSKPSFKIARFAAVAAFSQSP